MNDATFKVRVDTTVGALLADNNDFGHKPGRLLAITGDVVDERGGEPMTVTLNGSPVTAESFDGTPKPEPATVTVTSGGDVTEGYDVRHDPVPHGADVGSGGSIQRLVRTGKDGVREVWVGRSSKKEVDKGVIEQPVDLVVEAINPRPAGRKVIALTFDDGPSQYTGRILDVLKDKGVKATFFNLGQNAANNAAAARRVVRRATSSPRTATAIRTCRIWTGMRCAPTSVRVRCPTRRRRSGHQGVPGPVRCVRRTAVAGRGRSDRYERAVDIDTLDWKRPGAEAIVKMVLDNAHNGAIVLMHDGGGDRSQDIEALPDIIDKLREQGYEFVTVEQLAAMA